ncbi:dynein 1 light intermediate chain [Moniliophthora roreri MCA 2997]|uniref:Dynein 1 light intermediate chain n=1 Tax=Moniliophthora roreri (strain MCA 2997) TaxID=1381753 RepID=V2XN36_MONRO|nr:dynein 1 light intermediate chain [Moniliophthora roreri MCA 2997]KAI3616717.1 dynein 1 light intermediate chain [Moniliophthora roreri]
MDSRPATPEAPPENLWSSILDSVSSTRSIPSKQILILGKPLTGKSTLASALLQKPVSDEGKDDQKTDFALGYDYADVRDEGDEDMLARLSVYTVPSSDPTYTRLLPHFLPPRTSLPHTLVMIVLDWTRPWTFVEELETWLKWVEDWAKGDGSRELDIVREENRERWMHYLLHYTEPSTDPIPATSTASNTVLPLSTGSFTHNSSGVPIVIACTKADLIDEGHDLVAGTSGMGGMVKGKGGEWEERTDGVMQILRTICLKYGASMFYTTQQPSTLQVLRQYALHALFVPPAPSPAAIAGTEAPAPVRNPFPFNEKPNTLDRDRVVIPAGWDSWGKITVLRDFDPKAWGEAWEQDLESADGEGASARRMFSALVSDQGRKPPLLPPFNNPVPEQQFLAKNYDENSKKADRDPRGAFRNPADMENAAGVVGPLGSSSFNLPNVERALSEMESGIGGVNGPSVPDSRKAGRPPGVKTNSGRPPSSPSPLPTSPSPTGQTQHEVLQNFFQSLLSNKDRPSSSAAVRAPKLNGSTSSNPDDSST